MGTPFLAAVGPAFIAVLWHQAQMVLRIAALVGHDPTKRGRASEILLLQRALVSLDSADAALDDASERASGRSKSDG